MEIEHTKLLSHFTYNFSHNLYYRNKADIAASINFRFFPISFFKIDIKT